MAVSETVDHYGQWIVEVRGSGSGPIAALTWIVRITLTTRGRSRSMPRRRSLSV